MIRKYTQRISGYDSGGDVVLTFYEPDEVDSVLAKKDAEIARLRGALEEIEEYLRFEEEQRTHTGPLLSGEQPIAHHMAMIARGALTGKEE